MPDGAMIASQRQANAHRLADIERRLKVLEDREKAKRGPAKERQV